MTAPIVPNEATEPRSPARETALATTSATTTKVKTATAAPTNQPGQAGWSSALERRAERVGRAEPHDEQKGPAKNAVLRREPGDQPAEHARGDREPEALAACFEEVHRQQA